MGSDRSRSPSPTRQQQHQEAPPSSNDNNNNNTTNDTTTTATSTSTTKLYVGNLSFDTTEEGLRRAFSNFGGAVVDVFLPTSKDSGRKRGFGFVTLESSASEKAIQAMDQSQLDGRTLRVNLSRPQPSFNASKASNVKLYVGNLSLETTEVSLRDAFCKYGEIQDVFVPTDRDSGRPRGFAFVTMSAADAQDAMEKMNETNLDGNLIQVHESRPRPSDRGGGRGGRGGSDRYNNDRGGGYNDRGGGDRYSDRGGGYNDRGSGRDDYRGGGGRYNDRDGGYGGGRGHGRDDGYRRSDDGYGRGGGDRYGRGY